MQPVLLKSAGPIIRKIRLQDHLEIEAQEGETLLSALGRAGIPISAPCGGRHNCGKCKVKILKGQVRNILSDKGSQEFAQGEVLSCASIPVTDLDIALITEHTYDGGVYEEISRDIAVKKPKRAAVALDIGTTTISARLVDSDTGEELGTYSALNRQKIYGADIMSRISAAREGKTKELFDIINRQTEEILNGFMEKFELSSIETLIVSANTTMLHLFVNEDPSAMGVIPFSPVFLDEREYNGTALSLSVNKVFLIPSISAFIGGDIVSGLTEISILDAKESVFFIDIGTNGEMALFHQGKLLTASAAAGPALEGAEISCGVGSIRGAINKLQFQDGSIHWETIGGDTAVGICGCGLIDAIALMLEKNIIEETGAFTDDDLEEFIIIPESSFNSKISISNRDVRQYQLAKSAILSAIKILCKKAELGLEDIKKVYVAGGLGFYLDQKSAIKSGLLPYEFYNRIEVRGNTSLKGAIKAILEPDFFDYCKQIKIKSEVIDLASDPEFMDAFAENMIFDEGLICLTI